MNTLKISGSIVLHFLRLPFLVAAIETMSDKPNDTIASIPIDDLKRNMTILAYTGFSDRYQSIGRQVCRFLHHNFKGAKSIVLRNSHSLELPVEQICVGDTIVQLFSFPGSMRRLAQADAKLVKVLKKHGFIAFKIKKEPSLSNDFSDNLQDAIAQVNRMMIRPSRKQLRLKKAVLNANLLVERVKESITRHEEGSGIIENMMDNARTGQLSSREIEHYVESVIRHSSPEAMSAIINLRSSDQTYSHCIDVGVLFYHLYFLSVDRKKLTSVFQTKNQALLGAFLHDFGKSQLPKELLESSVRFDSDSKEMEMMRAHPHFGAKLLKGMEMPDSIINMCLCHHVKLDESLNSSYPNRIPYARSRIESRLLALVDIYQALVGKRTYKRSWTPPQAIRYLSALAGIEYEFPVWNLFYRLMGEYPIGSLVILNDDSMGFVMSVPCENANLLKPQVAIIKSGSGEYLNHHVLLDLQEEQDISIKHDLDGTEVFCNQGLKYFSELKVVA